MDNPPRLAGYTFDGAYGLFVEATSISLEKSPPDPVLDCPAGRGANPLARRVGRLIMHYRSFSSEVDADSADDLGPALSHQDGREGDEELAS